MKRQSTDIPRDSVVHSAAVPAILIRPDNETFRINARDRSVAAADQLEVAGDHRHPDVEPSARQVEAHAVHAVDVPVARFGADDPEAGALGRVLVPGREAEP